jgi:hypothetical protein
MLEVTKPAFEGLVQLLADRFDIPAAVATGLAPDGVFEFIEALLAWPFLSLFKMVAQEVEPSSLASIY